MWQARRAISSCVGAGERLSRGALADLGVAAVSADTDGDFLGIPTPPDSIFAKLDFRSQGRGMNFLGSCYRSRTKALCQAALPGRQSPFWPPRHSVLFSRLLLLVIP